MTYRHLLTLACLLSFLPLWSREPVAVKTNILYDATLTLNAGTEVKVDSLWTLDLSADLNAWTLGRDGRLKHWLIQPEVRRWLTQPMRGHFLAAHLLGGQFNVGGWPVGPLRHHRYQGWGIGAGVGYGYSWLIGGHWRIEAEIGLGYIWRRYDKYSCAGCGRKVASGRHAGYIGPTKAAVNVVYEF